MLIIEENGIFKAINGPWGFSWSKIEDMEFFNVDNRRTWDFSRLRMVNMVFFKVENRGHGVFNIDNR